MWAMPRQGELTELLDQAVSDEKELATNLRDIRFINRMLGWTSTMVAQVAHLTRDHQLDTFSLLDLASGSADIPMAIARWARGTGRQTQITVTDISAQVLKVAKQQAAAFPEITAQQCDALQVSFPPGSFDIVTCTLAMHHFPPNEVIRLLQIMARLARHAFVVSDVERDWLAYVGAQLLGMLLRNRMTSHDTPTTVLRAYTRSEAQWLVEQAGLTLYQHKRITYQRRFPYQLLIVGEQTGV